MAASLTAQPKAGHPVAPVIDPPACAGCDACALLGPQDAIALESAAGDLAYRLPPVACTGCGIFVDVCADRAIALEPWASATFTQLALAQGRCGDCGVGFHRPAALDGGGHARCPVCERTRHRPNLSQVYD